MAGCDAVGRQMPKELMKQRRVIVVAIDDGERAGQFVE